VCSRRPLLSAAWPCSPVSHIPMKHNSAESTQSCFIFELCAHRRERSAGKRLLGLKTLCAQIINLKTFVDRLCQGEEPQLA
jgi:hypothetical protein